MDTAPFWMGGKMGWLRKILQKEYNETPRTNNLHIQQVNNDMDKDNETEDWLKMLINELAIISGDVSLTPTKIITGWGTQKMRILGLKLKKQLREGSLHRGRKTRGRLLPHKPKIHRRNGNMGYTKDKDKRNTTNSKRSQQYRIWRNQRHTGNNNNKSANKTYAKINN